MTKPSGYSINANDPPYADLRPATVTNTEGIAEGYLSECEDQVRTLEWQLSEAMKENHRLQANIESLGHENQRLRAALEQIDRIATNIHIGEVSAVHQIHTLIASHGRVEAIPCKGDCGHLLHSWPTDD